MSYNDPILRARLKDNAMQNVHKERIGDKGYYNHFIGMTRVHIEQGLVYAEVTWGIDGRDMPVSAEVEKIVESFVVTDKIPSRADGVYILRDNDKKVLARARVKDYFTGSDKSEVYVSGKDRKDVVKLYELEGNLDELRRLRRQVPTLERQVASRDETIASLKKQLKNVRVELAEAQAAAAS